MIRRRASLVALCTLLALSCAGAREATPEPAAPTGINERFLDPELDVDRFVRIFEGESREISVRREAIAERLELSPGMRVADVGAGTGLFLEPLAEAVGDEGKVYAVDISPRLIEHMDARVRDAGWGQVETVLCSERSADLPPDSVDLVFVCDTYHHFEYPEETLASLRSALRSGGRLVIVDFERIPGVSRQWVLDHVRAGKQQFIREIEAAGFVLEDEPEIEGLLENYMLRFRNP